VDLITGNYPLFPGQFGSNVLTKEIIGINKSKLELFLFHYSGMRVLFLPILPAGVIGFKLRQPTLEIHSLDAHQPFFVRVPERVGLPVVENKGSVIGPSRGNQGKGFPVNFTAVHSRQVNQGSVGSRDWLIANAAVGDLMPPEPFHRIRVGFLAIRDPDNPQRF